MSLIFRWLGVAGLELRVDDQVLAIDPFFTRPTLLQMLRPVQPSVSLVKEKLPACNHVLVTHPHYDHLLDVPQVLCTTGAIAYGSASACQLLHLLGVPGAQARTIQVGDQLTCGAFQVEVVRGRHSPIPFGRVFNGGLKANLHPPLYVWDYRMDSCFGFLITVMGTRLLVCAAEPHPANILFSVAQEPKEYYLKMLQGVTPQVFIPIHWDNFTRPLSMSIKRFTRPSRLSLEQLAQLCHKELSDVKVIIPEIFSEYTI